MGPQDGSRCGKPSWREARPGNGSGTKLVIVESPTKARVIGGFLGAGYVVEASSGHIRDLPRNAADVPAAHKGEAWARLGVNTDNDFEPLYVVSPDRKEQVSRLKGLLKDADELYLATDEDREGEAIAWHLVETLNPKVPVRRMVFHEITPEAIAAAVANPREIDAHLVDAQETRRILDRLYGYEVSPVLWKKVLPRLSAGRVQSVATRIIVERERARMRFHVAQLLGRRGDLRRERAEGRRPRDVHRQPGRVDDVRIAAGATSIRRPAWLLRPSYILMKRVRADSPRACRSSVRGLAGRREALPPPPIRTVHDVDAAARGRPQVPLVVRHDDAGCAAAVRERLHHLYEDGLDQPVRDGPQCRPGAGPRVVRRRVRAGRGARLHPQGQERAGGARGDPPVGRHVPHAGPGGQPAQSDEFRLYELIWQRTLASQMADAVGTTVSVRIGGESVAGERAEFATSGRTITFPGFMRAYVEETEEAGAEKDDAERRLPQLARGNGLTERGFVAKEIRPLPAPLHQGIADQGARRTWHRPPIDSHLYLDRADDPRPGYVWKKGDRPSSRHVDCFRGRRLSSPIRPAGPITASPRRSRLTSTRPRGLARPWLRRFTSHRQHERHWGVLRPAA